MRELGMDGITISQLHESHDQSRPKLGDQAPMPMITDERGELFHKDIAAIDKVATSVPSILADYLWTMMKDMQYYPVLIYYKKQTTRFEQQLNNDGMGWNVQFENIICDL